MDNKANGFLLGQGTIRGEATWKDAFNTCRMIGGSLYNVRDDHADDRQLWGPAYWKFTPWIDFVGKYIQKIKV